MVLAPLFLAAGAVATSVAQRATAGSGRRRSPRSSTTSRSSSARCCSSPPFGVAGPRDRRRASAPLGHLLVQVPACARLGARIRPRVDLARRAGAAGARADGPRAIGLGATQLVFLVMTSLASTLGDGAMPVFNFAFAMLQIPIGVIGVPLGIVLLPSLVARGGARRRRRRSAGCSSAALAVLAFVMVAITALGIVVSEDVVAAAVRLSRPSASRCSTRPARPSRCSSLGLTRPLADRGARPGVLRAARTRRPRCSRRSSRWRVEHRARASCSSGRSGSTGSRPRSRSAPGSRPLILVVLLRRRRAVGLGLGSRRRRDGSRAAGRALAGGARRVARGPRRSWARGARTRACVAARAGRRWRRRPAGS